MAETAAHGKSATADAVAAARARLAEVGRRPLPLVPLVANPSRGPSPLGGTPLLPPAAI